MKQFNSTKIKEVLKNQNPPLKLNFLTWVIVGMIIGLVITLIQFRDFIF